MDCYDLLRRDEIAADGKWNTSETWDYFVSAFNKSSRLRQVYDNVSAGKKLWFIHSEYRFSREDLPSEEFLLTAKTDESSSIRELFDVLLDGVDAKSVKLCIDLTGFLRPHILFMARYLDRLGVDSVDFLYSEPERYAQKEATTFSLGVFSEIRPVHGLEGVKRSNPLLAARSTPLNDLLIIGMGYDDRMIAEVSEEKDKARKIQLFGLPPLRADMYQESVIRSRRVAIELADPTFSPENRAAAPANDPFATASVLGGIVADERRKRGFTHLYLAPLGTKAQALGFALFYIAECVGTASSVIFPFSEGYTPETSAGFYKAWRYKVEFEALRNSASLLSAPS